MAKKQKNVDEDYGYDYEAEYESSKKPKKDKKKKGGFWGKFLAFFLGMLFGIIVIVGGVAGVGFYYSKQPLKKTVNMVDRFVPGDLYETLFGGSIKKDENGNTVYDEKGNPVRTEGILASNYANVTLSDFINDVTQAVDSVQGDGSLSAITQLSPKLTTYLRDLIGDLEKYGIVVNENALLDAPIKTDLSDYLLDCLKAAALGDVIGGFKDGKKLLQDNPILLAICYGEEEVDYVYDANDKIQMINGATALKINAFFAEEGVDFDGILGKLTLDAVLPGICLDPTDAKFEDDGVLRALAYGPSNRYQLVKENGEYAVKMLQVCYTVDAEQNKIYTDQRVEVIPKTYQELSTGFIKLTYADGKVEYVDFADGGKVYADENKTTPVLYKKTRVSDFDDADAVLTNLLLKDVVSADAQNNAVLQAIMYDGDRARNLSEFANNGDAIINGIYLKDALEVTAESESVLVYLAYGDEGTDFAYTYAEKTGGNYVLQDGSYVKVTDGTGTHVKEITLLGNAKPRTLQEMINESDTLIQNLSLATALGIKKDDGSSAILQRIAFDGDRERTINELKTSMDSIVKTIPLSEALGITKDDGSSSILQTIVFNGDESRTINDLTNNIDEIVKTIKLSDALGITKNESATGTDRILQTLAFDASGNPRTLNDLTNNLSAVVEEISLADALGITYDTEGTHPVLKSVVFDGTRPRTLAELKGEKGTELFDSIKLSDVIDIDDDNALMTFLNYGREGVHYTKSGSTITMLQRYIAIYNGVAYNEYGEQLTNTGSTTFIATLDTSAKTYVENGVTYRYGESVGTTAVAGGTATLHYLFDTSGNAVLYHETTLGDLASDHGVLNHLTTRIKVKELIDEEVLNGNIFLKHLGEETVETLPSAINALKIVDVYGAQIYTGATDAFGRKEVTRTWWFLLHEDEVCDCATTGATKCNCINTEHTITEFNTLVTNMQHNINLVTLRELSENGLITTSLNEETLNRSVSGQLKVTVTVSGIQYSELFTLYTDDAKTQEYIVPGGSSVTDTKQMGDLTVAQLFQYIDAVFNSLPMESA